jgi:hypothetical protein
MRPITFLFAGSESWPSRKSGGEVEEREGVRLEDLAVVEEAAEADGPVRDLDGEELVPRLGRGEHVAHRADAADPGGDARHLADGPPLAELLEAAELDDVEPGVGNLPLVVQEEGDLGVALDAVTG